MVIFKDFFGGCPEFFGNGIGGFEGFDAVRRADGFFEEKNVPDLESVGVVEFEEIGKGVTVFREEFASFLEVGDLIKLIHTDILCGGGRGHNREFPAHPPQAARLCGRGFRRSTKKALPNGRAFNSLTDR